MIEAAVAAVRDGRSVIVPTDTVYGLAAAPDNEDAVRELARLKGRDERQPIALVAADVDELLARAPELRGRPEALARALLPGPFTLVLPNPERRLAWLGGAHGDTIGVRVPAVDGVAAELLGRVGALAATSANLHGGPDPRRLADVPPELRAAVAAEVDAGELPGTPSTVVDLTGSQPVVVREGAVSTAETLERLAAAGISSA